MKSYRLKKKIFYIVQVRPIFRMSLKFFFSITLSCLLFFSFDYALKSEVKSPFIVVLGTAQDGGYPHAGCHKECCRQFYEGKEEKHFVSSIAVIDPVSNERFLFD